MDARLSGWSAQPIIEMLILSTLALERHVASLFCQHVGPKLPDGRSRDETREAVGDVMIDTVEAYAPGFNASIIARQVIWPWDLVPSSASSAATSSTAALADPLYSARPALGHADYRAPIPGLNRCHTSTHPGAALPACPSTTARAR